MKEKTYFKYGIFNGILKKSIKKEVSEILNLHTFLENICSLFLKYYVCISKLWHSSLLNIDIDNIDTGKHRQGRQRNDSMYSFSFYTEICDSSGVQFSTDGLEYILMYSGGTCM